MFAYSLFFGLSFLNYKKMSSSILPLKPVSETTEKIPLYLSHHSKPIELTIRPSFIEEPLLIVHTVDSSTGNPSCSSSTRKFSDEEFVSVTELFVIGSVSADTFAFAPVASRRVVQALPAIPTCKKEVCVSPPGYTDTWITASDREACQQQEAFIEDDTSAFLLCLTTSLHRSKHKLLLRVASRAAVGEAGTLNLLGFLQTTQVGDHQVLVLDCIQPYW
eukprot:GHVR01085343.1.p1 GENE.GHVR01085343.1~~GHVR01085343.1.p1  ORF type:complete len:219 (+),score=19.30 GHVR01085343.1:95-751(+)